ncbi:MAG: VOC family protein [Gammaproteobacteria bacterium]|nr:VOC family protein [Gammaproteobacteria bacterium]
MAADSVGAAAPLVTRVDRMLMAVRDRHQAADTFVRLLGAQRESDTRSDTLSAEVSVLRLGESELELCEPAGPGPVADHLGQWGEGLLAMGLGAPDIGALRAHLDALGETYTVEGDRLHLGPSATAGLPLVVSPWRQPARAPGFVTGFYEATNTLDSDWRVAAARYARLFALEPGVFSPIANKRFGYEGTLTLFDPDRLDRIELSQTFAAKPTAMRRFVERRGDSLYMCFVEAHDFDGLKARLLAAGAQLTARGGDLDAERDTVWVHPRNLHGMLLGISRTDFAWIWSGRPERVPALR